MGDTPWRERFEQAVGSSAQVRPDPQGGGSLAMRSNPTSALMFAGMTSADLSSRQVASTLVQGQARYGAGGVPEERHLRIDHLQEKAVRALGE